MTTSKATNIALLGISQRQISSAVLEFDWTDTPTALIYIQSSLRQTSPLHYYNYCPITRNSVPNAASGINHVSKCILEAFLSLLSQSCDYRNLNVAYQLLCGPQIDCCKVFVNTLVMDLPSSYLHGGHSQTAYCKGMEKLRRKDLVVAVFDCSLEFPNPNSDGVNSTQYEIVQDSSNNSSPKNNEPNLEQKILGNFALMLKRSHVDVVCCQKRIHPFLKRKLLSLGIRSLSNISVRYMGAIVQISVLTPK